MSSYYNEFDIMDYILLDSIIDTLLKSSNFALVYYSSLIHCIAL